LGATFSKVLLPSIIKKQASCAVVSSKKIQRKAMYTFICTYKITLEREKKHKFVYIAVLNKTNGIRYCRCYKLSH
jgi:hypothetical protein